MHQILSRVGSATGALGALVCAISGAGRVSGSFYLAGFEATTLFTAGMGLMLFACLLKLEAITARGD